MERTKFIYSADLDVDLLTTEIYNLVVLCKNENILRLGNMRRNPHIHRMHHVSLVFSYIRTIKHVA